MDRPVECPLCGKSNRVQGSPSIDWDYYCKGCDLLFNKNGFTSIPIIPKNNCSTRVEEELDFDHE